MVSHTGESFEIQNPVHIVDAYPGSQQSSSRTAKVGITPKKGLLIFGISLIGVLAIAGIAIAVSTSTGDSAVPSAPAETNSFKSHEAEAIEGPFLSPVISHLAEIRLKDTHKATNKKTSGKNSLPKAPVICETPECAVSAATLIQAIDETVDPCDDFYQFACGGWYDTHPVTDKSLGTFYTVDDLISERLLGILGSAASPGDPQPLHDIRTYYSTCLDTDTMNGVGIAPLWTQLTTQGGWPLVMDSWDSNKFILESALVNVKKLNVGPFVSIGIDSDFLNTSYKILYVSEGELGLSSTYLLDPDNSQQQIGYYRDYIANSAKLVRDSIGSGVTDASIDQEVDDLINFEIALAKIMPLVIDDYQDVLVKTNISDLQNITDSGVPGQFNWLAYFKALFTATDIVINNDEPLYLFGEEFMPAFSTLLSTTPGRTVANYIGWWWTMTSGDATTYAMRNVSFTYAQNMFGKTSQPIRSAQCVDQTNSNLGFPTSRAYIDLYFPLAAKPEVAELVELIRAAFQSMLDVNTWMAPEDIVVAKEKLAAIVDFVAYPDWIMDNALLTLAYNGLTILPGEQYDNLMRMADFFNFWDLETFRDPAQVAFQMPPTIVNAFYDVFTNSITILAGILQPPFYAHNSLAAVNYGAIGLVIGHEFTHGFDNTGRRFDKNGNYANWWSQETIDAFNERASCFVAQYDTYSPPELDGTGYNMSVNGKQTLGENIADNGGIREAFTAYTSYVQKYGEEPRLPGLDEFTPNQLFFLGFANVWCEHRTTNDLVRQLQSDPHSPGRFRVIGSLSNDADFSNAWNCPIGSPMNRGNASCVLW